MSNQTKQPVRADHPMTQANGHGDKPVSAVARLEWGKPTNKAGLELLSRSAVGNIEKALPKVLHGQGERIVRAMITECQKNPALYECTPLSLFSCVMQAGSLGLTIGGVLGEAYMVPFNNNKTKKKEAQLIVGYKGLVQLANRSGQVRRITPVIVREGDEFHVYRGLRQDLIHIPVRNNKNRPSDYYVVVELMNGGSDFETMTFEEAISHRDRYSTTRNAPDYVKKSSPWYDMTPSGGFDWMALKTLVRRIAKRIPLSVELSTAVSLDEKADEGHSQPMHHAAVQQIAGMPEHFNSESNEADTEPSPHDGKLFDNQSDSQQLPD